VQRTITPCDWCVSRTLRLLLIARMGSTPRADGVRMAAEKVTATNIGEAGKR